jgi:hypothetical protein
MGNTTHQRAISGLGTLFCLMTVALPAEAGQQTTTPQFIKTPNIEGGHRVTPAEICGGVICTTRFDDPRDAGQFPRDQKPGDVEQQPPAIPLPSSVPPSPRLVRLWGEVTCAAAREACPPHPLPWTLDSKKSPLKTEWRVFFSGDWNVPFTLASTGQPLLPMVSIAAINDAAGLTWEGWTDTKGRYALRVPPGHYRIIIDEPPYARLETFVDLTAVELHGPNPLLDGDVKDPSDFIPYDATRLDLALTPDPDPHRCPAEACQCARCFVFRATEVTEDPQRVRHVHGVEMVAIDTQGKRWYSRAPGGLAIFSTMPPGWYYLTATYPPPGSGRFSDYATTDGWKYLGERGSLGYVIWGRGEYVDVPAPFLTTDPIDGVGSGAVFDRRRIESTPLLNGRTLQSLLSLVPGIVITDSVGTLAQFTAAGQRRTANRMSIDGIDADLSVDARGQGIGEAGSGALPAVSTLGGTQTLIPLEAIEDVQVRTSDAPSEHAKTPGAQTIIVTRAGSERFTGAAFADTRTPQLGAADWFSNANGEPARRIGSRNVGTSLGGPLLRRRIFSFGTWEWQQVHRPLFATVPTPSNGVREAASTTARTLLDAFPLPNGQDLGGGLAEYSRLIPAASELSSLSLRLDAHLSAKHRVFARLGHGTSSGDWVNDLQRPFVSFSSTEATATNSGTGGLFSIFSSFTHDLRVNVTSHRGSLVAGAASYGEARRLPLGVLGPQEAWDVWSRVTLFAGPGGFLINGRSGSSAQEQEQIVDTWAFQKGRHAWRFGFDYRRVTASSTPASDRYTYRFNGIADLLQGRVRQVLLNHIDPARARLSSWSAYAEDTFRLAPRLTVDYGLRYGVEPAPQILTRTQPLLFEFGALPDLTPRADGKAMWNTTWTNVAPRVAGTYQLGAAPGRETNMHAGWGLVFDKLTRPGAVAAGGGYPFIWTRVIPSSVFPVSPDRLTVAPPTSFSSADVAQAYVFQTNLRPPRSYEWHVSLDQEIGRAQRLAIGYAGAAGRDLVYWHAYYGSDQTHTVNAYSNDGASSYHALLVEYERRLARGFQARAAYSWSHAIDVDSGETATPNPPPQYISPSSNKASADWDRRHVLHVTASYRLPDPKMSLWLASLASGWQADVVGTLISGAPISVINRRDIGYGTYTFRPDAAPGVPVWQTDPNSPTGRSLNPAAFPVPGEARQGTLGRNTLRASLLRQVDLTLTRSVPVGNRVSVRLRVEARNVFNVPNFASPQNDQTIAGFGTPFRTYADALGSGTLTGGGLVPPEQVGGPRAIQLGVRLGW